MFKKKKRKEAAKSLLGTLFIGALCYFLGRTKTKQECKKTKEQLADCTATAENLSFLIYWYRNDIEKAAGDPDCMTDYEKEALNKAEEIYRDAWYNP